MKHHSEQAGRRTQVGAEAWSAARAVGVLALAIGCALSFAQKASPDAKAGAQPAAAEAGSARAAASAPVDPRQAQLAADAQKLVQLSQELKAEVAKSSKDTLSLTVVKKAEEVEKLAKALKEEMNRSR